ncbi:MAG: proline racemase family protein [Bryobacterales bacterium]|nr:proline racemase family protein [Bryobacterales bacterium]
MEYVDSHTGGEPTRLIIDGGPELGPGTMAEKLAVLRRDYDWVRSAAVNEPRGSDVMVGALLCEPNGVIFFNNVGYLGMCGHGAIGVVATLAYLGRIGPGAHVLETPVGAVTATLHKDGSVSIANVESYRKTKGLTVEVEGLGPVTGDVAWGGNWFFIANDHGQRLELAEVERLTEVSWRIRQAVNRVAPEVDHVELCVGNRNFVLCPGKAYDRSPCGTGTSAKLACLAADGKLRPGEVWRQESIVGSVFEGTYAWAGERVRPTIKGRAWVSAHGKLLLDPADPFMHGIRA